MPGEYEEKVTTITIQPMSISLGKGKSTQTGMDQLILDLNTLTLDRGLSLSKHPAKDSFKLPETHVIITVSEFQDVVNDDAYGPLYLRAVALMVDQAVLEQGKKTSLRKEVRELKKDLQEVHLNWGTPSAICSIFRRLLRPKTMNSKNSSVSCIP